MDYRWIEDPKEFQDIADRWDGAVLRTGDDNPFLLAAFILTWWKYYSRDLRLRIFVVYQDGDIIGGVPLCQNSGGYLEYPGGWAANYTELLAESGHSDVVWKTLFQALAEARDWRCLRLRRYRRRKLNFDPRRCSELAIGGQKHSLLCSVIPSDWAYLIDIPEDFAAFVQHLPKKFRYYLRRALQNASMLGEIRLYSLQKPEEINEWFQHFVELSRASFARRGKVSAFADPQYCIFFRELLHRFYAAGYLEANVLKLNGRISAVHFGYSLDNNLNYVLTAFDSDLYDLNPGHLLIYKLVERAAQRGSRQFDFYTGYHLYKSQWSNRQEDIVTVEIWRDGLRNRIERAIRAKIRDSSAAAKLVETIRAYTPLRKTD